MYCANLESGWDFKKGSIAGSGRGDEELGVVAKFGVRSRARRSAM